MGSLSLVIEEHDNGATELRVSIGSVAPDVFVVGVASAVAKMKKDGFITNRAVAALINGLVNVIDNADEVLEGVKVLEDIDIGG